METKNIALIALALGGLYLLTRSSGSYRANESYCSKESNRLQKKKNKYSDKLRKIMAFGKRNKPEIARKLHKLGRSKPSEMFKKSNVKLLMSAVGVRKPEFEDHVFARESMYGWALVAEKEAGKFAKDTTGLKHVAKSFKSINDKKRVLKMEKELRHCDAVLARKREKRLKNLGL